MWPTEKNILIVEYMVANSKWFGNYRLLFLAIWCRWWNRWHIVTSRHYDSFAQVLEEQQHTCSKYWSHGTAWRGLGCSGMGPWEVTSRKLLILYKYGCLSSDLEVQNFHLTKYLVFIYLTLMVGYVVHFAPPMKVCEAFSFCLGWATNPMKPEWLVSFPISVVVVPNVA